MSERAKFYGRLAEAEDNERVLKTRMKGLVEAMRDGLDPLADPGALGCDVIAQQALDLAEAGRNLAAVRDEIKRAKDILGF